MIRTFLFPMLLPVAASALAFSDVPSDYRFRQAIDFVQSQGIVSGYPDGTFKPDQTINRAEFTKIIIASALGYDPGRDPSGYDIHALVGITFTDAVSGAWYIPFLRKAVEREIIGGYPDGTFGPERTINFAEAAKILSRAFELEVVPAEGDVWWLGFIEALRKNDALPLTYRGPEQAVTRGEMADMVFRLKGGAPEGTGGCVVGGCNGELCLEEGAEVFSTCVWKEEFECYDTARCERQSGGACGWTDSAELSSCLQGHRGGTGQIPAQARAAYETFTADVIGNGEKSLLFFYASWCPYCREDDTNLTAWYISPGFSVPTYRVNYDEETELKKKYGVIQQHTYVLIDGDGTELQSLVGPSDEAIRELLN